MQSSQPVMLIWSLIFSYSSGPKQYSEHVLPIIETTLNSLLSDDTMLDTAISITQGPNKDPYQLTYLELGLIAALKYSNIKVNLEERQYNATESFIKALFEYQNQENKETRNEFIVLLNFFKARHQAL